MSLEAAAATLLVTMFIVFWIVPCVERPDHQDRLWHRRRRTTSEPRRHHQEERSYNLRNVGVSDPPVVPSTPSSRHRTRRRSRAQPPPSDSAPYPILFYHRRDPYYEFTNFAPWDIRWRDGNTYPTAEHLFQAHKFMITRPDLADRIRGLPSPRAALDEAGRLRRLQRTDWFDVNISVMDAILEAKFTQHPELRDMLLGTGESKLIEDSPVDSFWGWGHDGRGRNELGKALMRLRAKLRSSH